MPENRGTSSAYPSLQFRFRSSEGSQDIQTLRYLKSFARETNSMLLEPIRAWWMPIACEATVPAKDQDALRKLAFQSVCALCSRARYLCTTFDLDPAAFGLSASAVVLSTFPVQASPPPVPSAPVVGSPHPSVSASVSSPAASEDSLDSDELEPDDFNEDEVEGYSFYAAAEGRHFNTAGL